jgi:membrane protein DedA with SNARE-associated domain
VSHLPDIDTLTLWLTQYGSVTLFILLALGIVALPVPEETLMVIAGIFMKQGDLKIPATMLAAYLGSMFGITVSYIIGRTAGFYLLHKYGGWLGITETRLQRAHQWFENYGKWTLTFGYFIPGVRHFTGVSAGVAELEYHYFALFAYGGALLWVSTFLGIGYFFGDYAISFMTDLEISDHLVSIGVVLAAIGLGWWLWRRTSRNSKR